MLGPRLVLSVSMVIGAACATPTPIEGAGGAARVDPSPVVTPSGPVPDAEPSTLRVALTNDPRSLDPRYVLDAEGELVVRALFDGLVDVTPRGWVGPSAAESWTVEDDGLTYRFRLRQDRFHDGSQVTAQHHAEAMRSVLDPTRPPYGREDLLAAVREVEVIGPRELVVRLERPDPQLLHRLSDPVLSPLPALAVQDPESFARQPIGNGPFRMLGPREPGAFIRLAAWAAHPRPPRIEEMVLQIAASDIDGSQRWTGLVDGRLQIAPITPERRDAARERFGTPPAGRWGPGLYEEPLAITYAYGFAVDVPPFDDVLLRRAVAAAIDRRGLSRALASAGVEAATSVLPPSIGGVVPACEHCVQDVALARELLAAWRAGRPDEAPGPTLTLTYPRGEGHVTIAERVAADVERVLDLDVRLQARDLGSFTRLVLERRAPLFRLGLRPGLGGDAAGVSLLADAFASGTPSNWVGWADPETDAVLLGWSPGTPVELVRTVEQRLLDEAVVVPLLWTRPDLVVAPEVRGFHLDATGRWWPELLDLS